VGIEREIGIERVRMRLTMRSLERKGGSEVEERGGCNRGGREKGLEIWGRREREGGGR
jgi:hypothetical protein